MSNTNDKIIDMSALTTINDYANSLKKMGKFPVNFYSIFNTQADAETYATGDKAVAGEVIAVVGTQAAPIDPPKVYVIDKDGSLVEVGSKTLGDSKTIDLDTTTGTLSLHGYSSATNKQVPYKDTDSDEIKWQTVEGLIPSAIVPVGDNETISVVASTTSENQRIVSLLGKDAALTGAVLRKHINSGVTTYSWDVIYSASEIDALLANKQDKIDASNKLSADYIADGTTNKAYTATEQTKLAGISEEANKVTVTTEKSGKIEIDGTSKQITPDNLVTDASYKHITVSATNGVTATDGETYKYDDTAVRGLISTEETRAKGVEAGLDTRVKNLEARGRYLSTWSAVTGLPGDYPEIPEGAESPYIYEFKSGDYYIVHAIAAPGNNLQPNGASITATYNTETAKWDWTIGSKTYEGSDKLVVGGQFVYSTTGWTYVATAKDTAWGNITGTLSSQTDLQTALDAKVNTETGKALVETSKVASYDSHIADTDIHVTASQKTEWSGKQDALTSTQLEAVNSGITETKVTKLNNIAEGAQVNVLEGIQVAGNDLDITSKKSNIALGDGLTYDTSAKNLKLDLTNIILNGGSATI